MCEQGIGLAGYPLKATDTKHAKYAPYGVDPACLFSISMDPSYSDHTRKAAATLTTCVVSAVACPAGDSCVLGL